MKVTIDRYPTDPICLRISIGGGPPDIDGYYCIYRGTREQAVEALEKVLAVFRVMPEQPIDSNPINLENN
jgi:hypothetical protein